MYQLKQIRTKKPANGGYFLTKQAQLHVLDLMVKKVKDAYLRLVQSYHTLSYGYFNELSPYKAQIYQVLP